MGKKWVKVDPAEIKVGDRVKYVDRWRASGERRCDVAWLTVAEVGTGYVNTWAAIADGRTWYVRKPKPAKDTYYAELEAEVKELKAERDELRATLDELDAALLAPEPPTRPDEPPVGSFFRINGSPESFRRYDVGVRGYHCITSPSGWLDWIELTESGDTITILELTEVGDKRDADA